MDRMPVLFLCLLLGATSPVLAAPRPDSYMDSRKAQLVKTAEELVFNDRFAAADSVYREEIVRHPEDPLAYLLRAAGLLARMSDREEEERKDLFHALLDSADQLTSRCLDTCDDRTAAWMYLLRGHAKAYRSLWESKFGSFVTALKLGLAVDNEYTAGLKRDSSLYDIYAGLGSYHYWKSAKAGMLSRIGIFKNERDKGIAELELAIDSSLIHRDFSRSALVWIRLDCNEYAAAARLAETLSREYPDGKAFLWPLAQAHFNDREFQAALDSYRRLRDKLASSPGNYYNLVECDFYIVQCLSWLERPDEATREAKTIFDYEADIPEKTLHRQHSKISYLKRIARRR